MAAAAAASSVDSKPAAPAAAKELVLGAGARVEVLPLGAVVIRNFLSPEQQHDVYTNELLAPGAGSIEQKKLGNPQAPKPVYYSAVNALCLAVWRNLYTDRSNLSAEPKRLFAAVNAAVAKARAATLSARAAAAANADAKLKPSDDAAAAAADDALVIPATLAVDNLFAQLYPAGGVAIPHQDIYLDFVASLSFGDACEFRYGPDKPADPTAAGAKLLPHSVLLWSGDLLVLNAGKLYHAVERILPGSAPQWWTGAAPTTVPDAKDANVAVDVKPAAAGAAPAAAAGTGAGVERFGFARCNIQMRERARTSKDVPAWWGPTLYKVEDA